MEDNNCTQVFPSVRLSGETFWFGAYSDALGRAFLTNEQSWRQFQENELHKYNRWLHTEDKMPLEDYRCYIDNDKMVEALSLLGYKPVYILDYKGRVVWFLVDRYEA